MSDATVKIISNPYERKTAFEVWDGSWVPINSANNPTSKLLDDSLTSGFFPFKAEEIIRVIYDQYKSAEELVNVMFEGSDDEFDELIGVCEAEDIAPHIQLSRNSRHLINAREVLPEIVRIFKTILPLMEKDLTDDNLTRQIGRFVDASNDSVPLCVLGNYSSGKSTFINALIGQELLPNGDEPVTARVFQIRQSKNPLEGTIGFTYNGTPFLLHFNEGGLVQYPSLVGTLPYDRAVERVQEEDEHSLIGSMNLTLGVLNAIEELPSGYGISNQIEISVPFSKKDPWTKDAEYVIFDTPGSNAVGHEDHARVLQEAMEGMSNGMPIYVAEYNTLDARDNKALFDEIKKIPAVDERFAMIVVNKADFASLPKAGFEAKDRAKILDMAVPRNLYAQGIYFVSSIIALGEKSDEELASYDYADKYDAVIARFSNPKSRFYRVLYRYNILPVQITKRTMRESEESSNLILANSGMFCIENEIARFAQRYSAYNKCQQSRVLLDDIMRRTMEAMRVAKARSETAKEALESCLERDKKELLKSLRAQEKKARLFADVHYKEAVDFKMSITRWTTDTGKLHKRENELTKQNLERLNFSNQERAEQQAFGAIGGNFVGRVGARSIVGAFTGLKDDVDTAMLNRDSRIQTSRRADSDTSNDLIAEVRRNFDESAEEIASRADQLSRAFWEAQADKLRKELYEIATGSSVLTAEKRAEIADVIMRYPALQFDSESNDIFTRANFESNFKILNLVIFKSEKLDLHKLADTYNEKMRQVFSEIKDEIKSKHKVTFYSWSMRLLNRINEKITDYNPLLHKHVVEINRNTEQIARLTAKLGILDRCEKEVAEMIDWKE